MKNTEIDDYFRLHWCPTWKQEYIIYIQATVYEFSFNSLQNILILKVIP